MTIKICVLCHKKFGGYGNNPWPLEDEGSCCDECNKSKVIPARLKRHIRRKTNMTEQFKTLKDIDIDIPENGTHEDTIRSIKTEAVKIHKSANDHYKFIKLVPFKILNDRERKIIQDFLEWWCNIDEKDLKK